MTVTWFQHNLRYVLFLKKQELGYGHSPYPKYVELFAKRVLINEERFVKILLGVVKVDDNEKSRIIEALCLDDSDRYAIDSVDMREGKSESIRRQFFQLNIVTILDQLEHGEKAKVAAALGVNASTMTRWRKGTMPGAEMLRKISSYFGLESPEMLTEGYLFYRLEPATVQEKRQNISEALQAMDNKTFEAMYPALERLTRG